jgi:hypothetical protein
MEFVDVNDPERGVLAFLLDQQAAIDKVASEVEHDPRCIADRAALEAWVAKWPRYCQKCGSSGVILYGGSYHEPPSSDPCSCVDGGQCPRCGGTTAVWFEGPGFGPFFLCALCGWDERIMVNANAGEPLVDQHGGPLVAPVWECYCAEEAAIKAEERHA